MTTLENHIKDLIQFYVKTNYDNYLKEHKINTIPEKDIDPVIRLLYDQRKDHLKIFIKESLQAMLKEEYPGDLLVLNIILGIFEDDELCRNRLVLEVTLHQQSLYQTRSC
jgi:hypothetical protein